MNVEKELKMENVQGGAPEEPAVKLNGQERTNEENPLQVLSKNEAFLVPEFLDSAQAKEIIVPMVSNTLLSTEELDVLQPDSDSPKFSEKTIHPKHGDSTKSSAKTTHSKHGDISKTAAKVTNPKQGSISKTTGHPIQAKNSNIPKSLAKTTHPKQGNIHKSAANSIHHKEASIPRASEDTVQSKESDITASPEDTIPYKAGSTRKSSKDSTGSKEGDNHRSPEDTSKSQEGEITKSPEDTTQSQEANVTKSSEDTTQPLEGNFPKSSKEAIQPKEEETESLEPDMVKVITGKEDFEERLKEAGEQLVAVDFSATWCGPCRIIKPIFHSLSLKHEDVVFLEVDVDSCEELVQDCDVFCLPTFQFYKKEEKVGEFSGALVEKLESSIEELK